MCSKEREAFLLFDTIPRKEGEKLGASQVLLEEASPKCYWIHSLWGGCCQLLFRGGYRPGVETWLRIRYFDGYSILRLRDGSSSDLRGSKKLAKAL